MKRLSAAVVLLSLSLPLFAAEYEIDPSHSTVGFKVRHMVVSKTAGRFQKFSGDFTFDPGDVKSWRAKAVIDAASIDTAVAKRDEHLRGPDFFDVQKYPTLEFSAAKATGFSEGKAVLEGTLSLHGVTKPVTLNLEFGGTVKDPMGNERAGFTATTKINRRDFGLTWNKALEAGGVAVGEEVEIALEIEGIKKAKKS